MFLDYVNFAGYEITFSAIPTNSKPVRYIKYNSFSGIVEQPLPGHITKVPKTITVRYLVGEIVEQTNVIDVTERVPRCITLLGARKRPVCELPAAILGIDYGGLG